MLLEEWSETDEVLSCDATLVGCGGICGEEYFHADFPQYILHRKLHINGLELLTVLVALKIWGSKLKGRKILIYCDNQVSVQVINSGRARSEFLQSCLREIVWIAAVNQFQVKARHISSVDNRLSDLLSRWNVVNSKQFFSMIPEWWREIRIDDSVFYFDHNW